MGLPGLPVYEEIDLPDDNDDKPSSFTEEKKKPGRVKKSYKKIKRGLQGNKVTSQFFPPKGDVAENITLIIATIILFLMARAVLGTLAAPGGTIFAIFILILFSLIAGQIVIQCAALITKLVGVDIKIPQLLGMMAVGIALKNVPYNQSQFNSPECMNVSKSIHDHSDIDVNSTEFLNELGGFRIDPKYVHINHQNSDIAKSLKNIDNINQHGENSVDTENHPNSGPSQHTGVESISNNEDHANQNIPDASKKEPDNEEKHGLNHVVEKEVPHDILHDSNDKTVQQEKHNSGDEQAKDENGHHITTEEKEEVKHMQVSIMKDHNHTIQQEENIHGEKPSHEEHSHHEKEVMNIPVNWTPDNHHLIQQEEDSNDSEHSHDEHNHSLMHEKKEEVKNPPVHSTPDHHHMIQQEEDSKDGENSHDERNHHKMHEKKEGIKNTPAHSTPDHNHMVQQEEHSNNSEHSNDEHYHHEMHEKKEDIKNTPVHITPDRNYTIQQEEDTSGNEYSHDAQDVIHKKIKEVKHTQVHTTPDHNNKYEQLVNNDNPIHETNIHSLAKEVKDEVTYVMPHSQQDHNDKKVEHGRSDEQTKHKDIQNQNLGEEKYPGQHLHTDWRAQNQNNETVQNVNNMNLNNKENENSQVSYMTPHSILDHNEKKVTHQHIDNLNNEPITEVLNRALNKNELNIDVTDSHDINGQGISHQEKKEASQTPQNESKNQKDENGHDVKSDNIIQDNKEQALANNNTKMKTTQDDVVFNGTDIAEIAQSETKHDVEPAVTKIYQQNILDNSNEKDENTTENAAEDLVDTKVHNRSRRSSGHAEPQVYIDPCKKRFIGNDLDPLLTRTLRSICLTVILLMAGLELDPPALWRLKWIVLRTTFIPCIIEAFAASLFCYLILGFPFSVGLCFGFVLCGVSPAVIIPGLVNLSQRGYGVKKGIPTLVIATCSADDLVAIGGFGIALGITFNPNASITDLASHGPIEVAMGIGFGIFWGYVCQWLPSRHNKDYILFRFIILFCGGLFALFGAHLIHYDGAGGLACVIMAFVASIQWRKEGWGDHNPITDIFGKMWIILAPIIFSLIGTNIQVDKMNGDTVGLGVAVIVCCILTRSFFTYWSATFGGLNTKEKLFLSLTWLPKATVQAALGNNIMKPLILRMVELTCLM